jgi:site-specific recombinase XerD
MEVKMTEQRKPGRPKGTGKGGLIKYLSDNQLQSFMKVIKTSKRDDFLFSLMLYVGARVSEIANLKLDDINDESNQIVIRGVKSGNTRTYTINGKLWKKYLRWQKERSRIQDSQKNPYLFITSRGVYDEGMSRDGIQWLFKKYIKAAGIKNGFSAHSLRHTCAIQRVRAGHSAVRIQKWLRQKRLDSTLKYFELAGRELMEDESEAQAVFDKFL